MNPFLATQLFQKPSSMQRWTTTSSISTSMTVLAAFKLNLIYGLKVQHRKLSWWSCTDDTINKTKQNDPLHQNYLSWDWAKMRTLLVGLFHHHGCHVASETKDWKTQQPSICRHTWGIHHLEPKSLTKWVLDTHKYINSPIFLILLRLH